MTDTCCINCGCEETQSYDLMVRNTNHDKVPLCEDCHTAIERELN